MDPLGNRVSDIFSDENVFEAYAKKIRKNESGQENKWKKG